MIPIYDGTNAPISVLTGQTLPSLTLNTENFTLGNVYFNGAQLTQVQSWSLDFGIQVYTEGADGIIWETFAGILLIQPSFTITTTDDAVRPRAPATRRSSCAR